MEFLLDMAIVKSSIKGVEDIHTGLYTAQFQVLNLSPQLLGNPVCMCLIPSCVDSLRTHGPGACRAPLSMEFSRQKYWSGLPFPTPRDLPDPGIKPSSPALSGVFFAMVSPGKAR